MVLESRPLTEITQEALKVLIQTLGVVSTVRFINQFTVGYGNYTEEREELFGDISLDELITEIKRSRSEKGKSQAG